MRILGFIVLALLLFSSCSRRQESVGAASNADISSIESININSASAEELEKLPHIGRKTAEAIVEFRTRNGPFRRVEHLMQIRGVSEERFLEIRHLLRTE